LTELTRVLPEKFAPDQFRIFTTSSQGEGIGLASQALEEKYNWLISVGGDGTHNEVINGILSYQQANPDFQDKIVMALLPVGTGGDFQRSLGTDSLTPHQNFHMIIDPKDYDAVPQRIDVGIVHATPYIDPNQTPFSGNSDTVLTEPKFAQRYFINISSCGISAEVCNGANNSSKKLGGFATFMYQTCKRE
jgi:diacylglycerol kinase (ATP)